MSISKLVLFGNDPRCSRCKTFKPEWDSKEFKDFAGSIGAERIDAGMTLFKKTYDLWMAKAKVLKVTFKVFPYLMILDEKGKLLGHFDPSGKASALIKKIKVLCPDCCTDCGLPPVVEPPVVTMVTCPTCKGTGKVPKGDKKRKGV